MKIKYNSHNILYYILIMMPFVDMITGYAFNTNTLPMIMNLGQIYRGLTFIFLIYMLCHYKIGTNITLLLMFTAYLFLLVALNYLRFQGDISENISSTLKLVIPMYLVFGIYNSSRWNPQFIDSILNKFSWIYSLSLVIPRVMGVGFRMTNYAFESGYKGFYFANNEVNVILMVLFIYSYQKLYDDVIVKNSRSNIIKIKILNIVRLLLVIVSLVLIGSKTSILAILIVCFVYIFKSESIQNKFKFIALFFSVGLGSLLCLAMVLSDQISNMFFRIAYSYNRYTPSSGFTTFLLSERNLRVKPGVDYWYKNLSEGLLNFLFGVGKDAKCPNNSIRVSPFSLIELDFFDCAFWFGIIATCIVLAFYISVFLRALKVKGIFMEKVMFILVFMFSMTAGHVLTAASSGTIFGVVTAALYIRIKQSRDK